MASSSSTASNVGGRVLSGVGSAVGSVASATGAVSSAIGETVKTYETSTVLKLLRFLNMVNALGLVAAGVIMLMNVPTCTATSGCPVGSRSGRARA